MPPRKEPPKKPARKPLPQTFKAGNNSAGFGNQHAKAKPIHRRIQKAFSNEIERQLEKLVIDKNGRKLGRTLEQLTKRLIDIGLNGADKDAIKAIDVLMDRMEGKPSQAIEHSMNPDKPLEMVHRTMTPAEAARKYQAMLRSVK
jgi:hypothetical protein